MESFVLVCLNDLNKYVIVRESFIFNLNQEKVKNYGVNRNQDYKIHFKISFRSVTYFIFFDQMATHAEAERKRQSMRPFKPPTYNQKKSNEKPIPICDLNEATNINEQASNMNTAQTKNAKKTPVSKGLSIQSAARLKNRSLKPLIFGKRLSVNRH